MTMTTAGAIARGQAHRPSRTEAMGLIAVVVLALVASLAVAQDRMTWAMEVVWVVIALPWIVVDRRLRPTRLLAWLLAAHALVLIEGGAYTYARAPIGEWLQAVLQTQRNPWDRVGHLMQGVVPALLAREVLLRRTPLQPGGWLTYLCIAAALSFSAFFELIEWWSALLMGADADAFLATQGDVWDTQWDMAMCLLGAITSLALFSRLHDRQLGGRAATTAPAPPPTRPPGVPPRA